MADARAGLEALTLALSGHRVEEGYEASYGAAKADWERRVDAAYGAPDDSVRPSQTQVLGALDALVDDTDVIINAAGSLPGDLHKLWRARSRRQYHLEYGYSCMGYEIPAAIGVRLAAPDRPVWSLVGDGTYLMNPTEIVTAVQEGININIVLIQNHGYASIGGLSEEIGGERFGTAYRFRDKDGMYTGAPLPVDLAANAASLGMQVLRRRHGRRAACRARRGAGLEPAHMCLCRDRNGRHCAGRAEGAGLVGCACCRDRDTSGGGRRPGGVRPARRRAPPPPLTHVSHCHSEVVTPERPLA